MRDTLSETALVGFCELLNQWRDNGQVDALRTALAAIEAAALRGERDAAELMCRAIGAVTGIRIRLADGERRSAPALH